MSYCTLDQLTERFGERALTDLTDRGDEATGEVDSDVIDRAIADTGALIDGYLKGRYALPIVATPPLLTDLALTVAFYKLHPHVAPEKVRKDYEDAMRTLREISTGAVRLDVAGVEPAASGSSGVKTNDRPRDMTPDNMKGYV
ncbi:MAG: DUF1320 domain-containing protein [Bauldia sp.]